MIRAGSMRDLVQLLALVPTNDPRFGPTPAWEQYATAWANVTPLVSTSDATETFAQSGAQSVATFTIRTRYRPDIDTTSRITYREQPLEILSVSDPDGRQRELQIVARLYAGVQ